MGASKMGSMSIGLTSNTPVKAAPSSIKKKKKGVQTSLSLFPKGKEEKGLQGEGKLG